MSTIARSVTTVGAAMMALGIGIAPAYAAGSTVYLTSEGWFASTTGTGELSIDDSYRAPAGFGDAALVLETPSNADKATFGTTNHLPADLDDTAAAGLSYWTYRSTDSTEGSQDLQRAAINLTLDYNGAAAGGFTTLVFEPYYTYGDALANDVWQSWDATGEAKWWSTREIPGACAFDCFVALDDIQASNPDAVVQFAAVNQGSGNPGIISAADGFTVGADTYDFEPSVVLSGKDDCRGGGWMTSTDPEFRNQGDCVSYFASGQGDA